MMKQKTAVAFMTVLFILITMIPAVALASSTEDTKKSPVVTLDKADSYQEYLAGRKNASYPDTAVTIEAAKYASAETKVTVLDNYQGMTGQSLLTPDEGAVDWCFNVEQAGFYQLGVDYFPVEGKSAAIERTLRIDGELPFKETRSIIFQRVWADVAGKNGKAIQQDSRGNDLLSQQKETPCWQSAMVRDAVGYYQEPLYFYLTAGRHSLQFAAVQEPMVIRRLTFCQQEKLPSYSEVKNQYQNAGYKSAQGKGTKIQAEETTAKSDPMIVPVFDRSTSSVEPSDTYRLKLNTIGGTRWQSDGQWIIWKFTVPQTGLYKIGLKAVQNVKSGASSSRRIYIDGKVPFKELDNYKFDYSSSWQMDVLGQKNEPYLFYLTAGGTHELKMEVCLGEQSKVIQEVSNITERLNEIYRQILIVTGPNPDTYRDYHFDKSMPETIADLARQSEQLQKCYDELERIAGSEGENGQILRQVRIQTQRMSKKPDTIANEFATFQSNISSLGTWVTGAQAQPLSLDYLVILPPESALPKAAASWWADFVYQIGSFLSSFTNDYNAISSDASKGKTVTVWVGNGLTGGRDQAQILKAMADNDFTPKSGIHVNLQLISMGTLLPATLAGKGPDIALSLSSSEACNYAFRSAVVDLNKFPDFKQISGRFSPSSLTPLTYRGGIYGLPETQTFPMLFYRKDILAQLELSIPQTWQDVIAMLPVLQKHQLNFGLPSTSASGSTMTAFTMLLFQDGGSLYNKDGVSSALDSDVSVDVFSFLTGLYKDYGIPLTIDFSNRFRSGQIPIAIADYSMYNQLSVFAPELNGLWGFTQVPGTVQKDGKINRSVPSAVNASILMEKSKDYNSAWEFLKWWTDTDAQVKFGRNLESVMGTAARYPTANLKALYQIPWSKASFDEINNQWKYVKGIPEVPGSYYTPRFLDFAFRKSVYDTSYDPGEAITEAVKSINVEIVKKRREFKLTDAA